MIVKLPSTYGRGFRGVLNYLLDKKLHPGCHISGGTMVGQTPQELAREFGISRRERPEIAQPVFHLQIAYALEDSDKATPEIRSQIAGKVMEALAIDTTHHDMARITHIEKQHLHDHLVVSRIGYDGSLWLQEWRQGKALQPVLRALEKEHGLRLLAVEGERERFTPPSSGRVLEGLEDHGVGTAKGGLIKAVAESISHVLCAKLSNPHERYSALRSALEDRGLVLIPAVSKTTNRIAGYSLGLRDDGGGIKSLNDGSPAIWKASALGFKGEKNLAKVLDLPGWSGEARPGAEESIPEAVMEVRGGTCAQSGPNRQERPLLNESRPISDLVKTAQGDCWAVLQGAHSVADYKSRLAEAGLSLEAAPTDPDGWHIRHVTSQTSFTGEELGFIKTDSGGDKRLKTVLERLEGESVRAAVAEENWKHAAACRRITRQLQLEINQAHSAPDLRARLDHHDLVILDLTQVNDPSSGWKIYDGRTAKEYSPGEVGFPIRMDGNKRADLPEVLKQLDRGAVRHQRSERNHQEQKRSWQTQIRHMRAAFIDSVRAQKAGSRSLSSLDVALQKKGLRLLAPSTTTERGRGDGGWSLEVIPSPNDKQDTPIIVSLKQLNLRPSHNLTWLGKQWDAEAKPGGLLGAFWFRIKDRLSKPRRVQQVQRPTQPSDSEGGGPER